MACRSVGYRPPMFNMEEPVSAPVGIGSRDGSEVGHVPLLGCALGDLSLCEAVIQPYALLLQDSASLESCMLICEGAAVDHNWAWPHGIISGWTNPPH